jgi:hypothetical protein
VEEATGQLRVEEVERREADIELEGLQNSVAQVWDLVLGGLARTSSLAVSLSSATELIEDRVDAMGVNGVYLGTRSMLAAIMLHFPELGAELELLGYGCNMDPTEDQVDAIWTQTCQALESLAVFIPPSVEHGSPDDMGEE